MNKVTPGRDDGKEPGRVDEVPSGGKGNPGPAWDCVVSGKACICGGVLLGIAGPPTGMGGGGALTKAKGSVIGWVTGGIDAGAAAVCL